MPWELNDFVNLKKHSNAIIYNFWDLIRLSEIQFSDILRKLGAPKIGGPRQMSTLPMG